MANTQMDAGEYHLPEYKTWARLPKEVVNYSSAHDNLTLYDKLVLSTEGPDHYERQSHLIAMNKINAVILFTAQGGIFIQAGEEFARTKYGNPNTYNASIAVNHLDWSRAKDNRDLMDYYREMIEIRKSYPPLRDETKRTANMIYFKRTPENVLAYLIPNVIEADSKWDSMVIAANTGKQPQSFTLPPDPDNNHQEWTILANIHEANAEGLGTIRGQSIILNPREVYILAIER